MKVLSETMENTQDEEEIMDSDQEHPDSQDPRDEHEPEGL
jgi:hypothetical protein